jgi:hypothetical protein
VRAAKLLDRLQGVRGSGPGRWLARCPAHEDRSPSLSVRELDDGRVLLHDFGGCSAADVLAALGFTLGDLFPERAEQHTRPSRDRAHWHAAREALRAVRGEVLVVAIAAETLANGVPLTRADRDRLTAAAVTIREAAEVVR